ncbi:unnamed protein product [Schistosoma curassoni]|uniref:Bestrophin homolog n=1 Tax=Schistosoma curassoni TaxID=6186 RepID=A0A183L2V4_9TREM|nr:unnamed protein product [Schistosoma curassoni]
MQPFVPVVWATSLITLARKEGLIKNPHAYVLLVDELNTFRQKILYIMMMDDVCIPLVYTQVSNSVILFLCLFSRSIKFPTIVENRSTCFLCTNVSLLLAN